MKTRQKGLRRYLKIFIYILITISLSYLLLNETARKIFSRYIEYYKLSSGYERALAANEDYKKRLKYLENEKYMERIVKSDLTVIAEGEVEYHFNDKKHEENKYDIKN